MDGEREKAGGWPSWLDGTRPEAEASAEERGLLALRGRAQRAAGGSQRAGCIESAPARGEGCPRPKNCLAAAATGAAAVDFAGAGPRWD